MKVSVYVEPEPREMEVEINAEDCITAFCEHDEYDLGYWLKKVVNNTASLLNKCSDELIAEKVTPEARKLIADYLEKQAKRFRI